MWLRRAIAVWLVLMCAESAHGALRIMFLVPLLGDLRARQISFFTGSLLILAVSYLFVGWLRAGTTARLFTVGLVWLALTVLFELWLGLYVLHYSWARLAADYDVTRGGLMSFGLLLLLCAPFIAAKLRGLSAEGLVHVR